MIAPVAQMPFIVTVMEYGAVLGVSVIPVGAAVIVPNVTDMGITMLIMSAPVIAPGVVWIAQLKMPVAGMGLGAVGAVNAIRDMAVLIARRCSSRVGLENRQKAGRGPRLLGKIRPPAGRYS